MSRIATLLLPIVLAWSSPLQADSPAMLPLELQRRDPKTEKAAITMEKIAAAKCAVVVVDMWDYHWCTTWCGRAGAMIPRMNAALDMARKLGMTIVFSPTDCIAGHAGTPARERMAALPVHPLPKSSNFDPPAPWSFGLGWDCMCGGPFACVVNYDNSRQDPRLKIADGDYMCSGHAELHNLCREKGITHLLYAGGATNMCLCHKPEGMIGMTRLGYQCILCRDLTEAHGPNRGSDHADRNTVFSVAHIEKHIGPSVHFVEMLRQLKKWDESCIVDPVLIAPWGFPDRPKFFTDTLTVSMTMPRVAGAEIRYTLDGNEPTAAAALYTGAFAIKETAVVRAAAFRSGKKAGLESGAYYVKLPPAPPIPDVFISNVSPVKTTMAGWTDLYEQGPAVPPPQRDQAYPKGELRLRNVRYLKGLGLRAPSHLVYDLKPEFDAFVAKVGVDESCLALDTGRGRAMYQSAVFRVFLDGKQVAESPVMRISQEPWRFQVPIPKGARRISLAATRDGPGGREDLIQWVNAGFTLRADASKALHSAVGKKVTLAEPPDPAYSHGGPAILTDGKMHAIHQRNGCLGFQGRNLEAIIDLGETMPVSRLAADFLQDTAGGIYLPREVEFAISDDGKLFRTVATVKNDVAPSERGPLTRTLRTDPLDIRARFVRVIARTIDTIPSGQPAAGAQAWLFVDELLVNPRENGR